MFFLTTLYVDVKEPGRGRREMGLARSTVHADLIQAPVFPAESAGKLVSEFGKWFHRMNRCLGCFASRSALLQAHWA
jgi:hypothetical protein